MVQPGYVPKDAYDMTTLVKTIGICTHDGIVILDPMKYVPASLSLRTISFILL